MTSSLLVAEECLRMLLPIAITYICESGFSTIAQLKFKPRNRLEVAQDTKCALSQLEPRYEELAGQRKCQSSH